MAHHLTNGNCKMPCSGILGSEKLQSGFALCAIFASAHFFVPVKCYRIFLIGHKKTSPILNVKRRYFAFKLPREYNLTKL